MTLEQASLAAPSNRVLTEAGILAIHGATLKVLAETGVRVAHPEGLDLLRARGCQIRGKDVALISGDLVEECIASAPSSVAIFDRLGQEAMRLEGRRSYFGLGTDLIHTRTWKRASAGRPGCRTWPTQHVWPGPVPTSTSSPPSLCLPTCLPIDVCGLRQDGDRECHQAHLLHGCGQGRPGLHHRDGRGGRRRRRCAARPSLPDQLFRTHAASHAFLRRRLQTLPLRRKGVPVCYTPAAMLGASAPVTLAGGLVQTNAEALSGMVLHQLRAPGAPIISGVACRRSTCARLVSRTPGRKCGWATRLSPISTTLQLADLVKRRQRSQVLDTQGAWENAVGILLSALDGANLIHDVAYLGQGLLGDPASIVLCDEIISYVKRLRRGFDTGPDSLAVEAIERIGAGGNYLGDEHTCAISEESFWQPQIVSRDNPDIWGAKGSQRHEDRARQRALEILASSGPAATGSRRKHAPGRAAGRGRGRAGRTYSLGLRVVRKGRCIQP